MNTLQSAKWQADRKWTKLGKRIQRDPGGVLVKSRSRSEGHRQENGGAVGVFISTEERAF